VNVSSPNTPNLRDLQEKSALDEILAALQEVNRKASLAGNPSPIENDNRRLLGTAERAHWTKPILVKIAPDLSFDALDELLQLIEPREVAGIVATNTTITRPETTDAGLKRVYAESGGLSGHPLRQRSTEIIRHLYRQTKGEVPVIGVGGIFSAIDAWEKIRAGASLVQVYTGLIYEGPSIAKAIVAGLRTRLVKEGLSRLEDAVGRNDG
jgi:dihydroorotate dehydrogenase